MVKKRWSFLALVLVLSLIVGSTALAQSTVTGTILGLDKYGNATLDLLTEALLDAGFEFGDMLQVEVAGVTFQAPFVTAYSDVDVGSLLVRGPGGEPAANAMLAVNMGNFAGTYGVAEGGGVSISLAEKGSYLSEWLIRQLKRTNERSDYPTDEVFANFRAVNTGQMGKGIYYRSSSPVNNELQRAAYADALMKSAGIRTVINLADGQDELDDYLCQPDFNSPYYQELYQEGRVVLLNMGVDFRSADFQGKLKSGLEFLIAHEGPYLIHCNEGKDRAGFVSALLEALVGSTVQEIKEDYMITYMNYYGVEYGSEQYEKIAESNVLASLRDIAGLPAGASLEGVDLVRAAEDYLAQIGLSAEQIELLKARLMADAE
jgi:protein tyrosine/serine phosphatase